MSAYKMNICPVSGCGSPTKEIDGIIICDVCGFNHEKNDNIYNPTPKSDNSQQQSENGR